VLKSHKFYDNIIFYSALLMPQKRKDNATSSISVYFHNLTDTVSFHVDL